MWSNCLFAATSLPEACFNSKSASQTFSVAGAAVHPVSRRLGRGRCCNQVPTEGLQNQRSVPSEETCCADAVASTSAECCTGDVDAGRTRLAAHCVQLQSDGHSSSVASWGFINCRAFVSWSVLSSHPVPLRGEFEREAPSSKGSVTARYWTAASRVSGPTFPASLAFSEVSTPSLSHNFFIVSQLCTS